MEDTIAQLTAETVGGEVDQGTLVVTDEEREKARKKDLELRATRLSCKFVRIAGVWKKRCFHPLLDMEVLERVRAEDVVKDYGKDLGPMILSYARKCINEISLPSHTDYQEYIETKYGDTYYNSYRPLAYKPQSGADFPHIRKLVKQIFGEQEELGYDYIQLLYMKPMRKLPALLLVSRETGTGKSTFCFFLAALFGENAVQITPDTFRSQFASTWLGKLLVYCEETMLNTVADYEKAKNLVTASQTPSESKGKDWRPVSIFLKFIFCSNNEESPILLDDQDSRFWVRKVLPIIKNPAEPQVEFLEECKKEIPFFLDWLMKRQLTTAGTDRLWFLPEETRTDAWRKIVAESRDTFERSLINLLLDTMKAFKVDELRYSKTELNQITRNAPQFSDADRRKSSDIQIKDILHRWGLKATQKTRWHKVYMINKYGQPLSAEGCSSNIYIITRHLLNKLVG